ncbi:MAG: hypothetical protein AABZ30_07350 [Myxococcota bacterium]
MRAIATALLLALPAPAAANDKDAARAKLADGIGLYDRGDFAGALAAFEEAYRLYASPKLLVNQATCHAKLGRPVEALALYERFLADPGNAPAALVEEARRAAEKLRGEIGASTVTLAAAPTSVVTPPALAAPATPAAQAESSPPIYRRWWAWAGAGAIVAGGVVAAILLTSGGDDDGSPASSGLSPGEPVDVPLE